MCLIVILLAPFLSFYTGCVIKKVNLIIHGKKVYIIVFLIHAFLSCMNIRWRICFTTTHESRYNSKNNYLVLWTTQNLFFLVLTTHITSMDGTISSEIHFNLRWMDSFPVVSFWISLFFAAVCIPVSKLLALYD